MGVVVIVVVVVGVVIVVVINVVVVVEIDDGLGTKIGSEFIVSFVIK